MRGDAGADGLRAQGGITDEIRFYNALPNARPINIVVRDTTLGGYANPHQDEGTDASGLPPHAASIVRDFVKDSAIVAAIGGLTPGLAASDASAVRGTNLPLIVLAPLSDDCAAVRGRSISHFSSVVSVAGAASLEALAVARLVKMRGYHAIGVMSEKNVKPRADEAVCLIDALSRDYGGGGARALSPRIADLPTLQRRAAKGELDGFVYFGPAERGALVCGAAGMRRLRDDSLAAFEHRGYDSSTLPTDCAWVHRFLDDREAGRLAAMRLASAVSSAVGSRGTGISLVTRRDMWRRRIIVPTFYGSTPQMRRCAAGSADRASFALVPARSWLKGPFVVYDRRCT